MYLSFHFGYFMKKNQIHRRNQNQNKKIRDSDEEEEEEEEENNQSGAGFGSDDFGLDYFESDDFESWEPGNKIIIQNINNGRIFQTMLLYLIIHIIYFNSKLKTEYDKTNQYKINYKINYKSIF